MKEIDWANLSFGYMRTDYNVRINFRNGKWGELEVSSEEYLNLHMAATCLHYGQEAFEGLKAFRGKDGKVRIFRLEENAARLQSTCQGILMAELPTERFKEAILKVVKLNERFIPPYETGASLYIRPLLIGTSAQVGVHPAEEYMFVVFVTPVGPYFKGGFSTNPYVLSVQREKSRKYSQSWQHQHAADELKTIAAAVNYLSEHGISNLDELDASLSSVSDKAFSIREGMKTAEQRMKELQKLMEYGRNYQTYKPIQDEYRQIRWKGKQEKFAEARRAELTLWDAANRYLHAHLPEGVKTLPISAWEKEYTALKVQREAEYDTLKETRAEVAELQKIRRCVDIALRADQPEQMQSRTKRHDIDR